MYENFRKYLNENSFNRGKIKKMFRNKKSIFVYLSTMIGVEQNKTKTRIISICVKTMEENNWKKIENTKK